MNILKGKPVAETVLADVRDRVAKLLKTPQLTVVFVGENAASETYIERKKAVGRDVGIDVVVKRYPRTISTKQLRQEVSLCARQKRTTGIIIQLPLANHINAQYIIDAVPPSKDVDGLSSKNMGKLATGRETFIPPTAASIANLLDYYEIATKEKHIVMVGSGRLVGRPTGLLFLARDATVSFTNQNTKDIQLITRTADILVTGAGKPHLISADWIKKGAVVIDAGTSVVGGNLVGDVNQQSISSRAAAATPVPGGVGPLTVAMLMHNIACAAEL